MKSHSSKAPSREAILDAVRGAVKAAGGRHITLDAFLASTGMSQNDLYRYFARWKEVLQAAGFDFKFANATAEPDELLADWGAVARKLRRPPCRNEYRLEGNYNPATIQRRFGGWMNVPVAFRTFARGKPEWADLRELISTFETSRPVPHLSPEKPPGSPKSRWVTGSARRRRILPLCGAPLDFGVFRYAPTTETGVILLFGSMAERLGYLIETVHPAYPDCKAVRQAGPKVWESVRIEFEFESRNFRAHRHDPKGCNLIVCWEHNWPECPVEVLALKR